MARLPHQTAPCLSLSLSRMLAFLLRLTSEIYNTHTRGYEIVYVCCSSAFFYPFLSRREKKKREWSTYSPAQQFLKRTCRPFYINRRREKRDKKQPSLMRPVYMRLFRRPALSSSSSFQHLNLFYSFFFLRIFSIFTLRASLLQMGSELPKGKQNKTKQNILADPA